MSFSNRVVVLLLLALVCAGLAVAQPADMTLRQNGMLVGAYLSTVEPTYRAGLSVTPFARENGRDAYYVSWWLILIAPGPTYADLEAVYVGGVLPASAIKPSKISEPLTLDIDIPQLEQPWVNACRYESGVCVPFQLASFPLKGTFTPTSGYDGTGNYRRSGIMESHYTNAVCTVDQSFTGTEESTTAAFSGTMGSVTIVAQTYSSSASIQLQKGLLHVVQKCGFPPPPPPPPPME